MENTVFIKDETEYIVVKDEAISEEQDPLSLEHTGRVYNCCFHCF